MSANYDIVLFGGGGDLSLRKLMPALYRAHVNQELTSDLAIIATVRDTKLSRDGFVARVEQSLQKQLQSGEFTPGHWETFSQRIALIALDITDPAKGWSDLAGIIGQTGNHSLFYFAIAPNLYSTACANLNEHGLIEEGSRVIVEKPIGYNRETAKEINDQVGQYFPEDHIYRIDHYLGKETVQNLMVLRFSNYLFEHLWDAKSIDHVQITLAETVGLEGRAGFYDKAGAVRDMVQNHLLQLLCLVTMEPATRMSAEDIRAEKIKVLKSLRVITGDEVKANTVRGQYNFGVVNGKEQKGYLKELGDESSKTETFIAIRAYIDNWRWAGVPFYLRTGKCLQQQYSEITIQFKPVSHRVFGADSGNLSSNKLVVRLQPDENIQLQLMTKDLDRSDVHLQKVSLNLNQHMSQQNTVRDAYKRLLLDALRGDPTLFIHRDEIDASWAWLDPMLEAWQDSDEKPTQYAAGTWGPTRADALLAQDGFKWRNPTSK
ncbi:MAG: glucose-6-phosphate 1-dehydrogenase [Alteromonadaceae bacterium]|jgi:glucose-6-phosphate 1-dehydrogenase